MDLYKDGGSFLVEASSLTYVPSRPTVTSAVCMSVQRRSQTTQTRQKVSGTFLPSRPSSSGQGALS